MIFYLKTAKIETKRSPIFTKICSYVDEASLLIQIPSTNMRSNVSESLNPFASIGHTGTSKSKVKVRDICLNISFLT